jgi:hypothetical protein
VKLVWHVEDNDVSRIKDFYNEHRDNDFVMSRRELNVESSPPRFTRPSFWEQWWGVC